MKPDFRQAPHSRAVRHLSLALALLIALLPVLSAAQTLAMGCQPDANRTSQDRPPCHTVNDPTPQAIPLASTESDCPHHYGGTAASHCPCPGQLVPASFIGPPKLAAAGTPSDDPLRCVQASPLPESPGEDRFRPPIHLLS